MPAALGDREVSALQCHLSQPGSRLQLEQDFNKTPSLTLSPHPKHTSRDFLFSKAVVSHYVVGAKHRRIEVVLSFIHQ